MRDTEQAAIEARARELGVMALIVHVIPECAGRMRAARGTTGGRFRSWRGEIDTGPAAQQVHYGGALLPLRQVRIVVDADFGHGLAWIDRAASNGLAAESGQDRLAYGVDNDRPRDIPECEGFISATLRARARQAPQAPMDCCGGAADQNGVVPAGTFTAFGFGGNYLTV